MSDDQDNRIVVEVPTQREYTPITQTNETPRIQAFKKGMSDAIALPDNIPDLLYTAIGHITIPALIASLWGMLPALVQIFLGLGVLVLISFCSVLYHLPECRIFLIFRGALVLLGLVLGSHP